MNGPSLQRFTLLSLVFHVSFLVATIITLRQSSRFVMPSPYMVNLVSSEVAQDSGRASQAQDQTAVTKETRDPSPSMRIPDKAKAPDRKEQEQLLSDRISALKAKKKIENVVRLRSIISLKGTAGEGKTPPSPGTPGRPGGSIMDDYYAKITREIWQNWVFPDTGDKNLEAVVAIRILRDGSVQISKIEKTSGNPLFDRTALKAITKASPLTPPPYEMEIGVRFYP